MAQADTSSSENVQYVVDRLVLWAKRVDRSLARVEYLSESTRQEVVIRLRSALAPLGIKFHEVALLQEKAPAQLVWDLLENLAALEPGVLSVSGFEETFLRDDVRNLVYLNYQREKFADLPLRQIWWLTPTLADAFTRAIPDLDSWFVVRLKLTSV
ncbi:hypothetical protein [Gloeobacter kilaueensis]|uniref:Tetratricopeptide repeat-containing protein n=1 Tax=Gloeobacter kilaueensis (strain ATCC BAA-2537 / CCAP 1431/1 / ULC 316 / JS1) TaxID=1183438 RepID=U5QKU9_GLOK1|nr:hypothetical protein [Gloeobacter kilaueensis]AGY59493.1 tetratricopeptide repeat-containing protein [Gloeobacter kilaueensis JS1]